MGRQNTGEISASIMCADFIRMEECLNKIKATGIEMLHMDIMDGIFVPNITFGACVIDQIRKNTSLPFDYHLMVDQPENKLDYFEIKKGDYVSVHCESTRHLQRTLTCIREMGAHPGVAVNPATPLCCVYDVLEDVDFILIMTVNPGFAGQRLIPHTLEKISSARRYLNEQGYSDIKIEVDGNVSFENAKKMKSAGAQIFVAGTSGIFVQGMDLYEAAKKLRQCISEPEVESRHVV